MYARDAFKKAKVLHIMLVDHFLKIKTEWKNLKKHDIQDVFIKMN